MLAALSHLISTQGYWVVAVIVALESMGVPAPGETTLVTAAIYAGTTHHLNIAYVIGAAAFGAILGDNIGFWVGHRYGYALLLRYGHVLRMNARRIKLGQYLFQRHGGKVVFFGRFIAILRALAALLGGINRMPWWRFFFFNAAGGIVWAAAYGFAAYTFGEHIDKFRGTVGIVGLVLAVFGIIATLWFLRRHESELEDEAERALPGPLMETHPRRL
jgi:membrane protein DedA with SNARE-associated domain